ncbi:MAG: cation/multidrug efflux pump [Betaproteobacteria bacterium]
MALLSAAIAVPALLVLLFGALAVRCARRRRVVATTLAGLVSTVFILACIAVALVGIDLMSWSRLTHEAPAAALTFARTGDRAFDVDVALAGGLTERLALRGDEWQIDARVLKWRPLASVLGFDTLFRLERLSGRYTDIDTERAAPHTVHRLHAADEFDVWMLVRAAHEHLPWVDALYGSAVYLPMADQASFDVSVGAGGLVARPRNDAARAAIAGWH